MKVNIFTMAYNGQETISRTIESILNQTFDNFQYYILDNGSHDHTWDIIQRYYRSDKRIIPLNVSKNDPTNGWAIFRTIINATDADYIVWCDADDAYTPDFLENMVNFAVENDLDLAACGYDKIDSVTGEVLKHRVLDDNLIIHDQLFADAFIQYRGFISYLWGKLYSTTFLKKVDYPRPPGKARICNDTLWTLNMFQKAKRVGIYGKAMYQYYLYPRSFSNTNINEESLSSYHDLWVATKEYIEHYGPISRLNEDFLYAIYLSLVDEAIEKIFNAQLDTGKKIKLLNGIFSDSLWKDTMERKADSQFNNLAKRSDFIHEIKDKIYMLPEYEKYNIEIRNLLLTIHK